MGFGIGVKIILGLGLLLLLAIGAGNARRLKKRLLGNRRLRFKVSLKRRLEPLNEDMRIRSYLLTGDRKFLGKKQDNPRQRNLAAAHSGPIPKNSAKI